MYNLDPLLRPRRVAFVGASPAEAGKLSSVPLQYWLRHAEPDHAVVVNPKRQSIDGVPSYATLAEVPGDIDCAVVLVPAPAVLGVLEDASRKHIPAAVVTASGFGETAGGGDADAELRAFLERTEMVLCGPNTAGIVNMVDSVPLGWCSFLEYFGIRPGPVAVVSQSGGMLSAIVARLFDVGLGVSFAIAIGNQVSLSAADYIDYLVADDNTEQIVLYCEATPDSRRLFNSMRQASEAGKPVIVLRYGNSSQGREAAIAHTGVLAGTFEAFTAASLAAGTRVAFEIDDLVQSTLLLQGNRRIGPNVGVLSVSGASAAGLADRFIERGLSLPAFSAETTAELEPQMKFGRVSNPFDLTGQFASDATWFDSVVRALQTDVNCDVVVFGKGLVPRATNESFRAGMLQAHRSPGAPLVVLSVDGYEESEDLVAAKAAGIPIFTSPAVLAETLRTAQQDPLAASSARSREAYEKIGPDEDLKFLLQSTSTGPVLSEAWSRRILEQLEIGVAPGRTATTDTAAIAIADELGYPVVLKASPEGVAHKQRLGLVQTDVRNAEEVKSAYGRIAAVIDELGFECDVLVAQHVSGIELFAGARVDAESGPCVVVGLGGRHTEQMGDVVVWPAPLDEEIAAALLSRLRAWPALMKAWDAPSSASLDQVCAVLTKLSYAITTLEGVVDSIEVNPLCLEFGTNRVVALDALVVRVAATVPDHG